jgi:hypothetical protein
VDAVAVASAVMVFLSRGKTSQWGKQINGQGRFS